MRFLQAPSLAILSHLDALKRGNRGWSKNFLRVQDDRLAYLGVVPVQGCTVGCFLS